MDALRLLALLVYTFGAFAYGAMLLMWVRELGAVRWGAQRCSGASSREADTVNGALLVVSLFWFLCNVAQLLVSLTPRREVWQLDVAGVLLVFAFPPLIMHATLLEIDPDRAARLSRAWRHALWPVYAACAVVPGWLLTVAYVFPPDPGALGAVLRAASIGLSLAFIGAAAYSIALVSRAARVSGASRATPEEPRERQARWSIVALFAGMAIMFVFMLWITATAGRRPAMAAAGLLLEVSMKSLPLAFVFVSAYFENRFEFFDLFVKRGAAFLLAISVLTIWFALLLPVLGPLQGTWAAPWIYAIALIPAVGGIPLMYRYLADTLDRRWLGRRFTAVAALKHFVSVLRPATSRHEAAARAGQALSEIFGAPASVCLEPPTGPAVAFEVEHQLSIDGPAGSQGVILMGPRASEAPYFSQDLTLLSSLADVLASVLDNLGLQQHKHEQEQLAQELTLHASRSELKALRAQINPHFLFNALNAIAGLIHRNPARADRTIEQLADVFRYALRSSDDEWTPLADELDFVRSYLAIEHARFGDRLQASVRACDRAATLRIPTMMVQTLVENAVKHGLTEVRGTAVVSVDAQIIDDRLVISVTDNGPGFKPDASGANEGLSSRNGYGLANIRRRLRGYFGDAGALVIRRDEANGLTVVSVEMPS
jgi:anti-sigma regulatory factor (Ser/Thr protein kinase)